MPGGILAVLFNVDSIFYCSGCTDALQTIGQPVSQYAAMHEHTPRHAYDNTANLMMQAATNEVTAVPSMVLRDC